MAISQIGQAQGGASSAGTAAPVTMPTVQAKDVALYVADITSTTPTFTDPTGWTKLDEDTGTSLRAAIWYKICNGTEGGSTVQATWTGSNRWSAGISVYRGVDNTTPFDDHKVTHQNTTAQSRTTLSATTVSVGAWLVSWFCDRQTTAAQSWTPPAGDSERVDATSSTSAFISTEINDTNATVAVGSYTKQATSGQSGTAAVMGLVALRPSDGAVDIVSSTTVAIGATIQKEGALAVTSVTTVAPTGVKEKVGAVAVSSTTTVTVAGVKEKVGAVAVSSTTTMSPTGVKEKVGALDVTSATTVSLAAVREKVGVLAVASTTLLSLAGIRERIAALGITTRTSLAEAALRTRNAGVAIISHTTLKTGTTIQTGTGSIRFGLFNGSGTPSSQQPGFAQLEALLRSQAGAAVIDFPCTEQNNQPATFAATLAGFVLTYSPELRTVLVTTRIDDWAGVAAGLYDDLIIGFIRSIPGVNGNGDPIRVYWAFNKEPEHQPDSQSPLFRAAQGHWINLVLDHKDDADPVTGVPVERDLWPCTFLQEFTFTQAGANKGRVPAHWMPEGVADEDKFRCVVGMDAYPLVLSYDPVTDTCVVSDLHTDVNRALQPGFDFWISQGWTQLGLGEFALKNDARIIPPATVPQPLASDVAVAKWMRTTLATFFRNTANLHLVTYFNFESAFSQSTSAAGYNNSISDDWTGAHPARRQGWIDLILGSRTYTTAIASNTTVTIGTPSGGTSFGALDIASVTSIGDLVGGGTAFGVLDVESITELELPGVREVQGALPITSRTAVGLIAKHRARSPGFASFNTAGRGRAAFATPKPNRRASFIRRRGAASFLNGKET